MVGDQIMLHKKLIDRLAYAHDASVYRLVPEAVARPENESDVKDLLEYAISNGTSVTFRTAGTSLSGQTVTKGIIAEVVRGWKRHEILDNGAAIQLQPGVIGGRSNLYLQPYHRRIGPDPASIDSAMIGGIISNNSSGMVCGVKHNSYHTLRHIRFILANGNRYDTSNPDDYEKFLNIEKDLCTGLLLCRKEIENNSTLKNKVRRKYSIKNTLGYSLNSFIDFNHPLDIFAHLLIGAEGTLAFISSVTLNTIPDPPYKTTGLALFNDVTAAAAAIPYLSDSGAAAVELMDFSALSTAKYLDDPPYDYRKINPDNAALLFEYQKDDPIEIDLVEKDANKQVIGLQGNLLQGMQRQADHRNKLWKIRKGLYPSVGAIRKAGTSVITEDLCYNYRDLPEVVNEMRIIFERWRYDDAVIFGHAKDGNLHFVGSVDLNKPSGVKSFDGLINDLADLTVGKFQGSLKAEHGTGRNMAPFVEKEWGKDLYDIMLRVKAIADPMSILNPGVILNKDKKVHLKDLKPMPLVNSIVDLCIECGFCEHVCPSRELTLTPRQRIGISRDINLMKAAGDNSWRAVAQDMRYQSIDTCATDGLCALSCPVNINTGHFTKELRDIDNGPISKMVAGWTVHHFKFVQTAVRFFNSLLHFTAKYIGKTITYGLTRSLNRLTLGKTPLWDPDMPNTVPKYDLHVLGKGKPYIYFTSCVNRVFQPGDKNESLVDVMGQIAISMGIQLLIPENIDHVCCGTPYSSKGYSAASKVMAKKTIATLYDSSIQGKIPVVVDTSPCTYQLKNLLPLLDDIHTELYQQLTFIDLIPFLEDLVRNNLNPQLQRHSILHPTCSTDKMGDIESLLALSNICAEKTTLPINYGCCAFAGDRGLLVPELSASATQFEADELVDCDPGAFAYSSSRTCEVGMQRATGRDYESIALLVRDYLSQEEVN